MIVYTCGEVHGEALWSLFSVSLFCCPVHTQHLVAPPPTPTARTISSFAYTVVMATPIKPEKDIADDASSTRSTESPRSVDQPSLEQHQRSHSLNLSSLKEATRHMSGLAARVTGWVDLHDHDEYVSRLRHLRPMCHPFQVRFRVHTFYLHCKIYGVL